MYCNVLIIKPFDQTFTYKVKKAVIGRGVKDSFIEKLN